MFYMPQYHNLPDGRQVFLRFPDPARHADGVSALLEGVPSGEAGAAFLSAANAHPMRLVLVAEIAGNLAACGLLELEDGPRMQAAAADAFGGLGLEALLERSMTAVAAQKGVEV
ncbi:MAG: hypothetical protein IKU58_09315 [Clostridia bacterium]|nr:hypothetical protein [Clostridia bacterium]